MTDETRETPAPPAFGDIILPTSADPYELPIPVSPYYALYRQGAFIHLPVVFGHGVIPFYKGLGAMRRLPETTDPKGTFFFTGPRLSAKVVNQAIHFFRRIFDAHHTEAEVIVTQNQATGEHRLFIPFQTVSHGGVRSIYNPEHIAPNHLVIGTIHSHCNFGAYHSGTDEADAREMDGIHLTIGMLQNDPPQIAAMVALRKLMFHYPPEDLAEIDKTDDVAPLWWDRYVHIGTPTDALRPAWASDEDWDKFMGRTKKITVVQANGTRTPWVPKPYSATPPKQLPATTPREPQFPKITSHEDLARLADNGWIWDPDKQNFVHVSELELDEYRASRGSEDLLPGGPKADDDDDDDDRYSAWAAMAMTDHWEDALGREFLDRIFDSDLIGDEDTDDAIEMFPESASPDYWNALIMRKLNRAALFLTESGYNVRVTVEAPRPTFTDQIETKTIETTMEAQVH